MDRVYILSQKKNLSLGTRSRYVGDITADLTEGTVTENAVVLDPPREAYHRDHHGPGKQNAKGTRTGTITKDSKVAVVVTTGPSETIHTQVS